MNEHELDPMPSFLARIISTCTDISRKSSIYNNLVAMAGTAVCNYSELNGWLRCGPGDQCVCVPKSGDLSDPNKWWGVMLMDVCSKIFSSVMNGRAFKLLEEHGTRFQFGGTPTLGCRDGLFVLKTLLTMQKNCNLSSHVAFVDLVKAYETETQVS